MAAAAAEGFCFRRLGGNYFSFMRKRELVLVCYGISMYTQSPGMIEITELHRKGVGLDREIPDMRDVCLTLMIGFWIHMT